MSPLATINHHYIKDNFMTPKTINSAVPHKCRTDSENKIAEIEKQAINNKMSYGQYVAILEGKKKNKYDIHR